jgi:hypothetical protein
VSVSSCGLLVSGSHPCQRRRRRLATQSAAKPRWSSPSNRQLLLTVCVLNPVNQSPSNLRPKAESRRRSIEKNRTRVLAAQDRQLVAKRDDLKL